MRKVFFITCIQFLIHGLLFGQTATLKTDKLKYTLGETVEVTLTVDFKPDSMQSPYFANFKVLRQNSRSTAYSVKNGEETISQTFKYALRPDTAGQIEVESIAFYYKGKVILAKSKKILIENDNLTEQEKEARKFKTFVEDNFKTEGSYRYVLNEEFGYIEIFESFEWIFQRRLSEAEFEIIKKIK